MRINWLRVILGGLLAGMVINLCEFLVNGVALGAEWGAAMKSLNRPGEMGIGPVAAFWLWGFLIGLYAMWLYVSLRPRFGAGPRTALIAGIAVWIPGSLLAMIAPAALHLFRYRLVAVGVAASLVEIVGTTLLAAWLYKDREAGAGAAAGK
jgi:hypothetical protein